MLRTYLTHILKTNTVFVADPFDLVLQSTFRINLQKCGVNIFHIFALVFFYNKVIVSVLILSCFVNKLRIKF
jgi:hypothetical protein